MNVEPNNGRPSTPTSSIASVTAASFASDHSPTAKHQDSQDSTDSWDMVDDLPLRWATDYVNLATTGSKLATQQVLFFELWKNEGIGARGTSMLAVATKTSILLYETPKGERSFRFVKVCPQFLAADHDNNAFFYRSFIPHYQRNQSTLYNRHHRRL